MMKNLIERVDGFIQHLDRINHISDKELEKAYQTTVKITVYGKELEIPFDAVVYNAVYDAVMKIREEL